MKSNYLVIGLLSACLFSMVSSEFEVRYITQQLVPPDYLDERTWENLYYIDESSYQPGGAIFLMIGSHDFYLTPGRLTNSRFFDIGREQHGVLVASQHRFYGQSRPTANTSLENLQYLSSQYAVDDLAHLIHFLEAEYNYPAVITHGFDHGAALAVWLEHRYPNLVHGTWASSATLLAIKDFGEFLVNTGSAVTEVGGQGCYDDLEAAFAMIDLTYASADMATLEETFHLCSPLTVGNVIEGSIFFAAFALLVGQLLRLTHFYGIQQMCTSMEEAENEMVGLAEFIHNVFPDCIAVDAFATMEVYLDIEWDSPSTDFGMRQVTYQLCREFGWFRSSNHLNHPFGDRFPVELFETQCSFLFGDMFTASSMLTFMDDHNEMFGGLRPNVTNVFFTDGALDPGRTIGVLESFNPTVEVEIIPYFAAGAEIYPIQHDEPPQVLHAKERAAALIELWIIQHWIDNKSKN